jgi:hypothetical protein
LYYTIFIDTNDNGVWDEPEDGVAFADYYPGNSGLVSVRVFRGGSLIRSYQGYWGEKANRGGARCEFYVDFADIAIQPGQPIRLILFARTLKRRPRGAFSDDDLRGGGREQERRQMPQHGGPAVGAGIGARARGFRGAAPCGTGARCV